MIIVFYVGLEVGVYVTKKDAYRIITIAVTVLTNRGMMIIDKEMLENRVVWESIKREIQEKIADKKSRNP